MRSLAISLLLLAGCAELAPSSRPPPSGPIVEKFEKIEGEVLWILYNGRLTRCWYANDKSAPVCMVPPVIKVPAELFYSAIGMPTSSKSKSKATELSANPE